MNTRIVELFIDDEFDESGIDAISLVSHPAHEERWKAFNSQKKDGFELEEPLSPYNIVDENFCGHNPKLKLVGEDYSKLIDEGWEIVRVEKITPTMVQKMNQEMFSNPNAPSELDNGETRIRFKYVGPRDEKNRQFCADMMSMNRVYTTEDIDELTSEMANEQFGYYSIFLWRGSFNCRHTWVRLIYKKDGSIRNSVNSKKGLINEEGLGPVLQPDTRTGDTIRAADRGTRKNGTPSEQWKPGTPRQGEVFSDGTPLTEKQKMIFGFDEEKKTIVGAAMVPNKMIIRYDELGNPYYVFFSIDSIKKMADKFLRQRRTDDTSIEHDGVKLGADKVYINESWVSADPVLDKSHAFGFELPAGTWFVSMKVEDPSVWKMIKDKSLTGFSVEGLFAEKSVFSKEDKQINKIVKILKSITDEQ